MVAVLMAWILMIGAIIFLWIISLCKVLLLSYNPSTKCLLQNGHGRALEIEKRNALLVIAHPDDESMFFAPTINFLTSRGHNLHIFCLSTGDADGKGNIRKQELFQACAAFKVPMQQLKVVDHPELQDGFVWNHSLLAKLIGEEVRRHCIDMIITFDNYGVSGHCNHGDVHHGVCKLLYDNLQRDIEAWELLSINIFRKYSGPIDIWMSMLSTKQHSDATMQCLVNEHSFRSFLAMAQHSSQWVPQAFFIIVQLYLYEHSQKD